MNTYPQVIHNMWIDYVNVGIIVLINKLSTIIKKIYVLLDED